ncbi:LOW QUALITY PROTEIN: tumor necrosis factor receptor superfamily member 9a [Anableps anableps]
MAGIFWMMGLALLAQGFLCILGDIEVGCKELASRSTVQGQTLSAMNGIALVKKLWPKPQELCTPCEKGTYTLDPLAKECRTCTQCIGALVHFTNCTPKSDTECRCKKGLACGDARCSFCVDECAKGYEPTKKRSCAPCPEGTFNDQIHQKCKPLSTSCPDPNHTIVFKGNASSDIICEYVQPPPTLPVTSPKKPDGNTDQAWLVELFVIIGAVMMCLIIFIVLASLLIHCKGKKEKTPRTLSKTPIIRTPTDDPRTLIAIECSFHEAQQEQGSSTESLISKDSSERDTV